MISIIGGGPVGCYSALHCKEATLFESQKPLQRKIKCAGLVSKSGIQRLGISLPPETILNKVQGAKFFSPWGREVVIDGKEAKAFVLHRKEFDNFLLNRAVNSGVNFVQEKVDSKKVKSLRKKSERVVLATGTNYLLQKKLSLGYPEKFLCGIQYEMKVSCDSDFVELHFNVPEFFSWIIPCGDYARVGLCSFKNSKSRLEKFIKKLKREGRISNEKILRRNFGIIPLYEPKIKTQYHKMVTVGDAASQVKATTGGGIVMGCLAAKFSSERNYEEKWQEEIGKELYLHLKLRNFLSQLSPKNLDSLLAIIQENKEIVEEKGDMDFASPLFSTLLKNPKFIMSFLSKSPSFLKDLLLK